MKQIIKITKTDALSFTLFVVPIVLVIMALAPFFFGDLSFSRSFNRTTTISLESSSFYLIAALGLLPITLFFYVKRLNFIKTTINNGENVVGKIIDIQFSKDRGYITYEYQVGKLIFTTTNRIMKSGATQDISVNDKIDISYNKTNPKQAFIRGLYLVE